MRVNEVFIYETIGIIADQMHLPNLQKNADQLAPAHFRHNHTPFRFRQGCDWIIDGGKGDAGKCNVSNYG